MKNKFLKVIMLFALLTVMFFSCRKEYDNLFKLKSIEIENAQTWFENYKPFEFGLEFTNLKSSKQNSMPDWEYAFCTDIADYKTVEMPIKTQGRFGFVDKESKEAYKSTHDERYIKSQTRLVILTEKKSNNSIGFLMTIIPDKGFREKSGFKSYTSTYKNWQKGFSGYILYHSIDGKFENGWKFENGTVAKKVEQKKDKGGKSVEQISSTCTDFYMDNWYMDCTDWYTEREGPDEYTGTSCGSPYVEQQYLYTECYSDYVDQGGSFNPPEPNIDIEGYNTLTAEERVLVVNNPFAALVIASNRIRAENKTEEIFTLNGHNDKSDAFRHAYFQALNVISVGYDLTSQFAWAHEQNPDQPEIEKQMDLYNNSVGMDIGLHFNVTEQAILDALNSGQLVYIKDGVIVQSNQ